MTQLVRALFTFAVGVVPASTLAHDGHGHVEASSWLHYFAEPVHAALLLLVAAFVSGAIYFGRRRDEEAGSGRGLRPPRATGERY